MAEQVTIARSDFEDLLDDQRKLRQLLMTTESDAFIAVRKSEYESLLDSQRWVIAYEDAGVDNWGGADEARRTYRELREEDGLDPNG